MTPEQSLWRGVIICAVRDAQINHSQYGAEWHRGWTRTRDFALVCDYAGLDRDAIRIGFEQIAEGKIKPYYDGRINRTTWEKRKRRKPTAKT